MLVLCFQRDSNRHCNMQVLCLQWALTSISNVQIRKSFKPASITLKKLWVEICSRNFWYDPTKQKQNFIPNDNYFSLPESEASDNTVQKCLQKGMWWIICYFCTFFKQLGSGACNIIEERYGVLFMTERKRAGHEKGCQIGFLMPNLTNLAFLEAVGVKKIVCFFHFNIWLFWRQLSYTIRLASWLSKYLAEKCYWAFLDSAWCIFSQVIW